MYRKTAFCAPTAVWSQDMWCVFIVVQVQIKAAATDLLWFSFQPYNSIRKFLKYNFYGLLYKWVGSNYGYCRTLSGKVKNKDTIDRKIDIIRDTNHNVCMNCSSWWHQNEFLTKIIFMVRCFYTLVVLFL